MTVTLTRKYQFSASHRLHAADLTDSQNAELYGKCNNPFGHGHNYALEVTASGDVDPLTGKLIAVGKLDRLVDECVLQLFRFCFINVDVPQFASLVPTTENLALVIVEILEKHWATAIGSKAYLHRVHIQETDRNGFEVLIRAAA